MTDELAPLQGLLDSILSRLATVESKVGIEAKSSDALTSVSQEAATAVEKDAPAVKAYDEHVKNAAEPFAKACDDLEGLEDVGTQIRAAWAGIRVIVVLGSQCKKPSDLNAALQPYLGKTQQAVSSIHKKRLDRKWDWHIKGMLEMLVCLSWVMTVPPPAPSSFVRDTIGSSDFWCNKIRKEHKGKDEKQIAFCDSMKKLILDLSAYLKEYHLTGLSWNPRGKDISQVKQVDLEGTSASVGAINPGKAPKPTPKAGTANIMEELAKKRTSDGSSAATGLKKVTRDQQTWRKEYKKESAPAPPVHPSKGTTPSAPAPKKSAVSGPPVCEYQDRGHKWIIENQTKETNPNGVCVVTISDPKQQAYIYKCNGATIQIKGKIKSVIIDSCTKCAVVFETAISACELVNCKSMQLQTTGVCPSFAIDKTDGCVIYLSKETMDITNFVTSKSSEMNVNFPGEDGEMIEAPIPEQFAHKVVNGGIASNVSDLYH